MSQGTTAYLTDKCEVQNRDVTGGKAVYARDIIEPGELVAVWSGRIIRAEALDELPEEIRRHTVQVEERLYLASVSADEERMGFGFPKEERAALVASEPAKFMMPLPSDERYNWVRARLPVLETDELREILIDAWCMVVSKKTAASYLASLGIDDR